jgi:3-phenylpropionate/cinnamic acid dioxygenase small subunit
MNLLMSVRFFYIYFRVKKKLTMSFLGKKYHLKKNYEHHMLFVSRLAL